MDLGRGRDPGILYKLRVLVNSVETPRAKELFVDFLTGDLHRDVHKLRQFSRYFKECPKLKRTYFDVLSHFQRHTHPHKRTPKTDKNLGAKKIKLDRIESKSKRKKLKKGIEENKEKHEKESAKFTPKNEDVKESVNCEFCKASCKKDKLYAHYAGEHNVYCPEEIIFNSGNVLVSTPMDTMGGTAKWFLEQREKAKENNEKKCKLCKDFVSDSVDLLRSHYAAGIEICGHKIDSERLKYVENFFRADKKSHFPPPDNKKPKKLSEDVKRKPDVKVDEKRPQNEHTAGLLVYVCKCDVATEKYDFAVEHAQRHVINCNPVTLTCQKCEFTFEATCFFDHIARYQNKSCSRDDFIQLQYDYTKLKSPEWYNMFNCISPISKGQIVQSSIYKYTRSIILKASSNTGIPVYQCAECQLCIDPNDIETHCNNKENCVKHTDHACSECKLHFINNNLLEAHKEDHKNGPPRLTVFNNKADVETNKALLKLNGPTDVNAQPSEESVKKKITVISDVEIPDRFCFKCHNYVNNSVFEEHRAKHEEEEKIRMAALERDANQSTSNNVEQDDNNEIITEGTSEVNHDENNEFSDTDSCSSVRHTAGVTNAMILEGERHQKVAIAKNKSKGNTCEDIIEETPEQVMEKIFSHIASTPHRVEDKRQSTQEIMLVLNTDDIIEDKNKKNRIALRERLRKMLPEDFLKGLEDLDEELSQLIRES